MWRYRVLTVHATLLREQVGYRPCSTFRQKTEHSAKLSLGAIALEVFNIHPATSTIQVELAFIGVYNEADEPTPWQLKGVTFQNDIKWAVAMKVVPCHAQLTPPVNKTERQG